MQNLPQVIAAIDYIEAHLRERLTLESVAQAVHYSKFHLHRLFVCTVGLTIHDYVKRRQLTEAAKLLVTSDLPILHIALLAGYESQQAFSDAFREMYKQPPGKFREAEVFYPLQLRFRFEKEALLQTDMDAPNWDVRFAREEDIPCWMAMVRLVIDGFPHLHEDSYQAELSQRIALKHALIIRQGDTAVGTLLFSPDTGSIDFMGAHPLYRGRGVPEALLGRVMDELIPKKEISITTFREGDRADTGHRRQIEALGFAEGELLVEYGYPTQRFIFEKEEERNE